MANIPLVTPPATLQGRAVDSVCFFYTAGKDTASSVCQPGTSCLQLTTVTPPVAYCQGDNPVTQCYDWMDDAPENCNKNQACCSEFSSCGTWNINGGQVVQKFCASTKFEQDAWNPSFRGYTGGGSKATGSTASPPSSTQSSPTSSNSSSSDSSSGDIGVAVGVIIGGIVALAGIVWGLWYFCCKRPKNTWWNRRQGKYTPIPEPGYIGGPSPYALGAQNSVLAAPPPYASSSYGMGPITSPPPQQSPYVATPVASTAQWQSSDPARTMTYRVEFIPSGFTREDVRNRLFPLADRVRVTVRSLAPSVGSRGMGTQTATIEYPSLNKNTQGPGLSSEAQEHGVHIDRGFQGWTPLNQPSSEFISAESVIAVTGLAGHAFGSWSVDHQQMWIRDYLPRDIPNLRVMTYGYNSQLTETKSRQDFDQHAEDFAAGLESLWEANYFQRPTIFIGHSLGCLIIKKALLISKGWRGTPERLENIVPLVIFLGAPHNGLATDALMTLVKGKAGETLIEELKPGSPTLKNLKFRFEDQAQGIKVLSIFERRETKTAIEKNGKWVREGTPVMMVEKQNAVTYLPLETRISSDTDHRQISRLNHTDGGPYGAIKRAIMNAVEIHSESQGFQSGHFPI